MTIHVAGRRLMHAIPLKFVQKHVVGGGGRSVNAGLSLTSMIDFLVVTVVFLLMTFSSSGETPAAKGVNIPTAINAKDIIDAPIVAISGTQLLVDGTPAGNTREIEAGKQVRRIDELFNLLKAKRDKWKQLFPNKEFPGVVILQVDQDVSAVVVKSTFQTAAFAGFPDVSFMVTKMAK
jgi:biopolymer transport protein ExbD